MNPYIPPVPFLRYVAYILELHLHFQEYISPGAKGIGQVVDCLAYLKAWVQSLVLQKKEYTSPHDSE
jgi:hypothetical protein